MTIYQTVKGVLDIVDVARRYGLEVKSHKTLCPFHKEKTPSLSFKADYFTCFGCGEKGDTISFVSKLFGLSPYRALLKLNHDFSLGLNIQLELPDNHVLNEYAWENELKQRLDKWVNYAVDVLIQYVRELQSNISMYAPETQNSFFDPRFEESVKKIDYYEYLLGILTCGDNRDRVLFYKQNRKEVEKIERRKFIETV